MASRSSAVEPIVVARFERGLFERARRTRAARFIHRLGRVWRAAAGGLAEAVRLLRTAPPLGDVGTRGNDLTAWVGEWNRPRDLQVNLHGNSHGNLGDSNRE
jgi:hypothetical protein